ncbi:MAG TPA: hypothetical protein VK157_02380 [Phycisphaerales bacterium]|nr:hypothetical protein [Phycisphaerales bacterium]
MVIAHLLASCVCVRRAARLVPAPAALLLAGLVSTAGNALAQPGGVAVTDLGTFSGSVSTLQSPNLTLTTAAPVAWYKIRLPRITDPHRYLDISTSGAGFSDSEIALYSSTGTLIASDDDDGANNYSALSFGITNPGAAGRVPPIAQAGQTAGAPFDGRDGTLSGDPMVSLLGTAGDYYIAVTRFDATFGNNFGVIPPAGPASDFSMLLTVRMNTPGGQVAPTVDGRNDSQPFGVDTVRVIADASANTADVRADLSVVGGNSNAQLAFDGDGERWEGFIDVPALTQPGTFPFIYRASNAIGDVTVDQASLQVLQLANECAYADQRFIASTLGTTVYTYTTVLGDVDGPWVAACTTPSFPPTGNDVWFRMFPSTNGTLTLSTCNSDTGFVGTQPDTLLGIREFCFDPFLSCGDDVGGCGVGTRLTNIPVTAGQEYNIAVRAWGGDIPNGRLAVTFVPGCDDIDFNNNDVFPEDQDVIDFFNVLAGADCPVCNDIDFNNNDVFPEDQDVIDFFNVLAGGACP